MAYQIETEISGCVAVPEAGFSWERGKNSILQKKMAFSMTFPGPGGSQQNSPLLGNSALDRLAPNAHQMIMEGESHRKKKAAKRKTVYYGKSPSAPHRAWGGNGREKPGGQCC
jgi:hypothetical protein